MLSYFMVFLLFAYTAVVKIQKDGLGERFISISVYFHLCSQVIGNENSEFSVKHGKKKHGKKNNTKWRKHIKAKNWHITHTHYGIHGGQKCQNNQSESKVYFLGNKRLKGYSHHATSVPGRREWRGAALSIHLYWISDHIISMRSPLSVTSGRHRSGQEWK